MKDFIQLRRPLHKWGANKNEIIFALFCLKNKRNSWLQGELAKAKRRCPGVLRVFLGERRWKLAILICASIYAKVSLGYYSLASATETGFKSFGSRAGTIVEMACL